MGKEREKTEKNTLKQISHGNPNSLQQKMMEMLRMHFGRTEKEKKGHVEYSVGLLEAKTKTPSGWNLPWTAST